MSDKNLRKMLREEVVIVAAPDAKGAGELLASLRPERPVDRAEGRSLPVAGVDLQSPTASTQRRVEEFLFQQAELLDGKHWAAFIDLFAEDGVYWMPATPEQTSWLDAPSIFAEDKPLMTVRMNRVSHPSAWSQAPAWGTSHLIGNVVIERETAREIEVRSRFIVTELRRDETRQFAGSCRYTLRKVDDGLRIVVQRVDLLTAQAPFEYVLQVWI